MFIIQMFGSIFMIAAVLILIFDGTATLGAVDGIVMHSLGEMWFMIHQNSLAATVEAIRSSAVSWTWVIIERLLHLPAWPTFAALGILMILAGRPRRSLDLFAN